MPYTDKPRIIISLLLATVSYDAYCSMMEYIEKTVIWNPYENAQELVKWIATYYSIHKDEGTIRKNCRKNLPQNRNSSRGKGLASDFRQLKEDRADNNAQPCVWDITFEELRDAYKTTALERHLPWDTAKLKEG